MLTLLSLLLASISDTNESRQRRSRVQELRGRLGLQRQVVQRRPYEARLHYIRQLYPPVPMRVVGWSMKRDGPTEERQLVDAPPVEAVKAWVAVSGVRRDRVAPMVPWLAREVHRLLAFDPSAMPSGDAAYEAERARRIMVREFTDVGLLGDTRSETGLGEFGFRRVLGTLQRRLSHAPPYADEEGFVMRDLPQLVDWFTATSPDLSGMSLYEAVAAADGWHAQLGGPIVGGVVQGEVVAELDDGWTLQRLTTKRQLSDEGSVLSHCVGGAGYYEDFKRGRLEIYSLRDPGGQPHLTFEVSSEGELEQVKGYGNQTPGEIMADGEDHLSMPANDLIDLARDAAKRLVPDESSWDGADALELLYGGSLEGEALARRIREDPGLLQPHTIHDHNSLLSRLRQEMMEYHDDKIVEAWAEVANEGESVALFPFVAWEQASILKHLPYEPWSAFDAGLEYERRDERDDVSPFVWGRVFALHSSDHDAQMEIRVGLVLWFDFDSYDQDGIWRVGFDVQARYRDRTRLLTTEEWDDAVDHGLGDPEQMMSWFLNSRTSPWSDRKVTYRELNTMRLTEWIEEHDPYESKSLAELAIGLVDIVQVDEPVEGAVDPDQAAVTTTVIERTEGETGPIEDWMKGEFVDDLKLEMEDQSGNMSDVWETIFPRWAILYAMRQSDDPSTRSSTSSVLRSVGPGEQETLFELSEVETPEVPGGTSRARPRVPQPLPPQLRLHPQQDLFRGLLWT